MNELINPPTISPIQFQVPSVPGLLEPVPGIPDGKGGMKPTPGGPGDMSTFLNPLSQFETWYTGEVKNAALYILLAVMLIAGMYGLVTGRNAVADGAHFVINAGKDAAKSGAEVAEVAA